MTRAPVGQARNIRNAMASKKPKILTDAGYEIYCDTKKLRKLKLPIVNFSISKLIWNFNLPFWEKDGTDDWNLTPWDAIRGIDGSKSHQKRVKKVNLTYPILLLKKGRKWLVIDGIHRLVKAYEMKKKTIKAKIIPSAKIK
jgi:hypothetical protein